MEEESFSELTGTLWVLEEKHSELINCSHVTRALCLALGHSNPALGISVL